MEPTLADLEGIYRGDYCRFLRVAEAITGDPRLASEAVNEGFAGAIRSRDSFRGEGTLESWVWACVVNAARTARRREPALATSSDEPVSQADDAPTGAAIRGLVAALPERQRLALFLRYYADLDYQGIARVLGVKAGTVAATLHKAHTALREALEEVSHEL